MAGTPEDESPSIFLDLPPPTAPCDGDDLVLPFIARMLMEDEEDMSDRLLAADHPELLKVQQPFAEIISDVSAGLQQASTTALPPVDGGGLQQVLGGDEADMVNQAFLRGMEEARKFLPTITTTSLLLLGTSGSGEQEEKKNRRRRRTTDEEEDDSVMCCCRRKKTNKLMPAACLPLPEETDDGETVETLLVQCAQAVGTNDRWTAAQLLRQIKRQSSPIGSPTQRLAHCFAEALEARLAGTGAQLYRSLVSQRTSPVEYLKAYQVYLQSCCFRTTSFAFSNRSILKLLVLVSASAKKKKKTKKLHIVDYGIHYGMQWPALLALLAGTDGGAPPELRITGIDHPQPGSSRLEETGRRLSSCARQLGVPFTFRSIASARWEMVRAADLDIHPDELLVVNSLGPFSYLIDEGVHVDTPSPRDAVLNNISKMRPDLFILCNVNASYSSPFFVRRFREALSCYSALFDMLDATIPRDSQQRLLVERDLYGRATLNVIACEGRDRVERPEAYTQWQVRNQRAGLRQLPLDLEIVQYVMEKIRSLYHKDFVFDTDQQWLLQGWKGRILYAMSTWVADDSVST